MAILTGMWLLPGCRPVPAAFRADGFLQLGADVPGQVAPKIKGYYRKLDISEQPTAILAAVTETGDVEDVADLRPLVLMYLGQGVWRRRAEKRTVFVGNAPPQQVLNFTAPLPEELVFRVIWCHPGRPPAVAWLRRDGKVEYSSDMSRRNVDKKNGGYVIKYANDAPGGRLEDIKEVEITFHYDGIESLASATLLFPLNDIGVFRAGGAKRNGKRKHFEPDWDLMELKDWHIVAMMQPIVA